MIGFKICNIAFGETSCLYNYRSSKNTKIGLLINVDNFLLARISMTTFVPILQGNKYAYISTKLFSKLIDWNGTSPFHSMYCPNSNRILVTKIDLLIVMNRLLNDLWSHKQAMTVKLALALTSPIRKDSIKVLPNIGNICHIVCCIDNDNGLHHIVLQELCQWFLINNIQ